MHGLVAPEGFGGDKGGLEGGRGLGHALQAVSAAFFFFFSFLPLRKASSLFFCLQRISPFLFPSLPRGLLLGLLLEPPLFLFGVLFGGGAMIGVVREEREREARERRRLFSFWRVQEGRFGEVLAARAAGGSGTGRSPPCRGAQR